MIIKEYKGQKAMVTITRYDDKDYCYHVKCHIPGKADESYWFGSSCKNDAFAYAEGWFAESELRTDKKSEDIADGK